VTVGLLSFVGGVSTLAVVNPARGFVQCGLTMAIAAAAVGAWALLRNRDRLVWAGVGGLGTATLALLVLFWWT
jgi:hypothetical protein